MGWRFEENQTKWRAVLALISATVLTFVFVFVGNAGPIGGHPDVDQDGVNDDFDICLGIANTLQRDDDEDGYGNLCDADVTQNCVIGGPDISRTFARLTNSGPWIPKNRGAFDINEDGLVGAPDLSAFFARSAGLPGPSARVCANCTATPPPGPGLGACP